MAKCTGKLFWHMNLQSDLKRHAFLSISKRFKGKKPKPPRDPPPASTYLQPHRDKEFDPFISSDQFETDPSTGGKWTKIDQTWSQIQDDKLQTSSPDNILSQYSESQILPRTKGIKTLTKFIDEEPYKHRLEPEPQIEIVAEDDNYIFVHKPAGIAVHGSEEYEYDSTGNRKRKNIKSKTYYEIFMEHWYKTYPFFRFEPRLLHRLDRNVSGVMVFGKKWCAEEHFANLLNGNSDYMHGCGVKKCYIAVCKGIPNKEQGIIEGRIRKAHWNYKRFAIYTNKKNKETESSQHVKTEYKVIDTCEHGKIGICSLIIFTIHTGKRHQIRATASALNTPIVGDVLYGGNKYNTMLLHSLFIGFEGIVDTKLLYGVSCLPKWSHLSNHFWSTKAQYHVKRHLDFLMTVPRPSKKPRVIQYSLRQERATLKRQLESGRNQMLLPMEKQTVAIDDGKMEGNVGEYKKKGVSREVDRSGLDKMEEFLANNFIDKTVDNHMKEMVKGKRRIKPYERMEKANESVYDPLLDGAVPEHYFMDS